MGNLLDAPVTCKDTHVCTFDCGPVGASGMQGWRPEMEDAHLCVKMPSLEDHIYLCVFDGHGGAGAAEFAAENLIRIVESTTEWKEYVNSSVKDPAKCKLALEEAFLKIDEELRAFQGTSGGVDTSGCTSVTCMITPHHFICANAGDSRCVLGTGGRTVPMSYDHKPTDTEESERILNAGGCVQWKRVDGDLAVSRAFGDFEYKKRNDLTAKQQKVSCFPDVKIVERAPEDDVLILACDGLWDVMSNEEAVAHVRQMYTEGEGDVGLIAEEMIDTALHKGSRDNISCTVVRLAGAVVATAGAGKGGVNARRTQREAEENKEMGQQQQQEEQQDDVPETKS